MIFFYFKDVENSNFYLILIKFPILSASGLILKGHKIIGKLFCRSIAYFQS